jgi:hypothetical protein
VRKRSTAPREAADRNKPLRRTLLTGAVVLTGTDLFQFYMPIYGHSVGLRVSDRRRAGDVCGRLSSCAW